MIQKPQSGSSTAFVNRAKPLEADAHTQMCLTHVGSRLNTCMIIVVNLDAISALGTKLGSKDTEAIRGRLL